MSRYFSGSFHARRGRAPQVLLINPPPSLFVFLLPLFCGYCCCCCCCMCVCVCVCQQIRRRAQRGEPLHRGRSLVTRSFVSYDMLRVFLVRNGIQKYVYVYIYIYGFDVFCWWSRLLRVFDRGHQRGGSSTGPLSSQTDRCAVSVGRDRLFSVARRIMKEDRHS